MRDFTILGQPVAKGDCKPIPNFEEYLALKDGNIFSTKSNKMLKQAKTKDGYLKVTLWKNGKGTTKKTHRFIAKTFLPNPLNKPQVNHINGDKEDNRVENLEWATQQENIDHAVNKGLISPEKARAGFQTKRKKYGDKYLSIIAKTNGSKSNAKKAQKTREIRYGIEGIKSQAKKASDKARLSNIRETKIIDIGNGQTVGTFSSRVEAAKYIGVDRRRITDSINHGKVLKGKYMAKGVEKNA